MLLYLSYYKLEKEGKRHNMVLHTFKGRKVHPPWLLYMIVKSVNHDASAATQPGFGIQPCKTHG